jgi:hypothetical protein
LKPGIGLYWLKRFKYLLISVKDIEAKATMSKVRAKSRRPKAQNPR